MKPISIIFVIAGLAAAVLVLNFIIQAASVSDIGDQPVVLDIKPGTSFNRIAETAYESRLTDLKLVFKIYSIISGRAHRFKSGRYVFNEGTSVARLTKILVDGPTEIEAIIFPGMTLKEIDDRLSDLKIIGKEELIDYDGEIKNIESLKTDYFFLKEAKSLEGFLLPDTYRFYAGSDIESVVGKILKNFKNKVLSPDLTFLSQGDNMLKLLTLASYLEKEIPDNSEREIAAGILEKRLAAKIPLQIDATVLYAKCSGRFLNCPTLEKIDFQLKSLYNTYFHRGLTPTPIGNPSLEAVKSAINKKKSEFWYYLSDPDTKKTIFSKTLDEHNFNRIKYLLSK